MPDFTSKLVLVQVPQKKAKNFSCYFRAAFSLLEPPCYVATAKRCFSTDVDQIHLLEFPHDKTSFKLCCTKSFRFSCVMTCNTRKVDIFQQIPRVGFLPFLQSQVTFETFLVALIRKIGKLLIKYAKQATLEQIAVNITLKTCQYPAKVPKIFLLFTADDFFLQHFKELLIHRGALLHQFLSMKARKCILIIFVYFECVSGIFVLPTRPQGTDLAISLMFSFRKKRKLNSGKTFAIRLNEIDFLQKTLRINFSVSI